VTAVLRAALKENQSAIVNRWLTETLASYQPKAAKFFRNTKDPFANPVGNALMTGMTEVLDCLAMDRPVESTRADLKGILKIGAVQDFPPSQALSFVFLLKSAVRGELQGKIGDEALSPDLAEFDSRVDQVALLAFETYVYCREQVYEMRVNEVKRSISGMVDRLNRRGSTAPGHADRRNESGPREEV
jgi:hypothetical protein